MNILYLSFDGMTDPLGRSQVIPYLEGLSEKGCFISIISLEKKDRFRKDFKEVNDILQSHNIEWYPIKYSSFIPIISALYNLFKIKNQLIEIFNAIRIDIVHCRSYLTSIIGLWLKKKKGTKFIFDMRGLWPDERIDGKIWNLRNPFHYLIFKYFKRKEMQFLNNADYVICITNKAKEEILSWKNIHNNINIEVIPCCVDLSLFNRENIDSALLKSIQNELKIPNKSLVVSYLGNIGTWYLFDEMLLFFKRLIMLKKDAIFLIISQNDKKFILDRLKYFSIDYNNIRIVSAERNIVPYYLSLSTVSVFFIKKCYSKIASSPTKLGEILGMGIPIICNSGIGDVDFILKANKCGFLVENCLENDYSAILESISNDNIFDRDVIVKVAKENFSLIEGVNKYFDIYKILNERKT